MTLDECINILVTHNEWRRGNDNFEMAEPKLIGKAIGIAVVHLRCFKSAEELTESYRQKNQALLKKLRKIEKILEGEL